ncbi:venom toxin OcyC11-like [Teleopsis dalmanni]|uniref:venom toxin OcyC11-like n=1 Tax=Teleopsis dalmanni TaxID=139649 RepID=UPI0018CD1D17|nr:venom toxin OcyC11-like [Teleopsis dalmanni]
MKYLVCCLILAIAITGTIDAAVLRAIGSDPKHPGKCVIDGHILSPKQKYYPPNTCGEWTCEDSSGSAHMYTCGVLSVPSNCKIEQDSTKRYPECCPRPGKCY